MRDLHCLLQERSTTPAPLGAVHESPLQINVRLEVTTHTCIRTLRARASYAVGPWQLRLDPTTATRCICGRVDGVRVRISPPAMSMCCACAVSVPACLCVATHPHTAVVEYGRLINMTAERSYSGRYYSVVLYATRSISMMHVDCVLRATCVAGRRVRPRLNARLSCGRCSLRYTVSSTAVVSSAIAQSDRFSLQDTTVNRIDRVY